MDGSLVWVHAARTDQLRRYTVSAKRGYAAMEDSGVLMALTPQTVLVTDSSHPTGAWTSPTPCAGPTWVVSWSLPPK